MLSLSAQAIIWMATTPVDFRKGIDGLAATVRQKFVKDPLDGATFLFYNKRRTTIKILSFDGQGFWLCMKRLSTGSFKNTPVSKKTSHNIIQSLDFRDFHILIQNGDPLSASCSKNWRSPTKPPP